MTKKIQISLAQWSLHRAYLGAGWPALKRESEQNPQFGNDLRRNLPQYVQGTLDPLEFPLLARRQFDISAVEYVSTFFFNRIGNEAYFQELKRRADGEGVRSLLIMCDYEGLLGAADNEVRAEAVERNGQWLNAAAILGCEAIRVNVTGEGAPQVQQDRIAESLHSLAEQADKLDLNVLMENHISFSTEPDWLVELLQKTNHHRIGALVDFGNWSGSAEAGVKKLMPFAKGVSAKSYAFDEQGFEITLDYKKLLSIVKEANYKGYIGIEFEGDGLDELEGIAKTKSLLEQFL